MKKPFLPVLLTGAIVSAAVVAFVGNDDVAEAFGGIESIPTALVIDREGRIVVKHVGYVDRETFEKEIKRLL